jgi:hypothetical protein
VLLFTKPPAFLLFIKKFLQDIKQNGLS